MPCVVQTLSRISRNDLVLHCYAQGHVGLIMGQKVRISRAQLSVQAFLLSVPVVWHVVLMQPVPMLQQHAKQLGS